MDAASVTPRFRLALGAVVSAALLVPLVAGWVVRGRAPVFANDSHRKRLADAATMAMLAAIVVLY